jgi:hypothetical protein
MEQFFLSKPDFLASYPDFFVTLVPSIKDFIARILLGLFCKRLSYR